MCRYILYYYNMCLFLVVDVVGNRVRRQDTPSVGVHSQILPVDPRESGRQICETQNGIHQRTCFIIINTYHHTLYTRIQFIFKFFNLFSDRRR